MGIREFVNPKYGSRRPINYGNPARYGSYLDSFVATGRKNYVIKETVNLFSYFSRSN